MIPFVQPRRCGTTAAAIATLLGWILFSPASRADELQDMRLLIEDGIARNLGAVRSFEARINERAGSFAPSGGKSLEMRDVAKVVYFEGTKWRQQIATTFTDQPTGKVLPYHSDSVYDGDKTLRLHSEGRSARIVGGNEMESRPSRDLTRGYTFWMWPLPTTLKFATKIRVVDGDGRGLRRKLLEVTLPSTRDAGNVTTMWLDPGAGFLIVSALGRD